MSTTMNRQALTIDVDMLTSPRPSENYFNVRPVRLHTHPA
jgi:hypothetical protein